MIDRASIMAWNEQAPWTEPFDPVTAYELVKEQLIDKMPGRRE